MRGRKTNKQHPVYAAYMEKCLEIRSRMEQETESIEYSGGLDGPLTAAYKKYALELKELQKEYSYLFS